MAQTAYTGKRGNDFGHKMGYVAAKYLRTELLQTPGKSNEAYLNGELIVIKSAHKTTSSIGIPYNVLDRVKSVVAVLEDKNYSKNGYHKYTMYKVDADWCKLKSTPSQSSESSSKKIGMVTCKNIKGHGEKISELICDF